MTERARATLAQVAARAAVPHKPLRDLAELPECVQLSGCFPLQAELEVSKSDLRHKVLVRRVKDALLKNIIERLCDGREGLIVNPCCVFARHARDIASRLPMTTVAASDIDSTWQSLYGLLTAATLQREPANFSFHIDSIYKLHIPRTPLAVCFFGGCGSLTDAALRLAVQAKAEFVVGRACCHENIGGNLEMSTRALTIWNAGHRLKNIVYGYCASRFGYYFDASAAIESYPLSHTTRGELDSAGMLRCAQHSVDCVLCRLAIDGDRVTFLLENGYSVLGYNENMFVASRTAI